MSAQLKALTIQSGVTQRIGSTSSLEVGNGINSTSGNNLAITGGAAADSISIGSTTTSGSISIGGTVTTGTINIGDASVAGLNINIGTNMGAPGTITIGTAGQGTVQFPGVVNFTSATASPDVSFTGNVQIGSNPYDGDQLSIYSHVTTSITFDGAGAHSVLQFASATGQNLTFAGGQGTAGAGGQAIFVGGAGTTTGGLASVTGGAGAGGLGGGASLIGGLGSTTGGAVTVTGGAGTATAGGAVNITSGNGATAAGDVTLGVGTGGTGTITIGGTNPTTTTIGLSSVSSLLDLLSIIITPTVHFLKEVNHTLLVDPSTTGGAAGGNFTSQAGAAEAAGAGTGGVIRQTAGAGGDTGIGGAAFVTGGAGGATSGAGGAVTFTGGAATSGAGGASSLVGGAGGTAGAGGATFVTGGVAGVTGIGGATNIAGGLGGATSGNGGAVNLTGGAAATEGVGGFVTIAGGAAATATSQNGGNVAINGGALAGGGTNGLVLIGQANTSAINLYANTTAQAGVAIGATGTGYINLPNNTAPSTVFFRIGGTAVGTGAAGANITAANFDVLFAGPTSDASNLHTHTSLSAAVTIPVKAGEAIVAVGSPIFTKFSTTSRGFNIDETNNVGARGAAAGNAIGLAATLPAPNAAGNNFNVQVAGELTVADAVFVTAPVAATDTGNVIWGAKTSGKLTMDVSAFVAGDVVQKMGILGASQGPGTPNANVVVVQIGDVVLL
jgi:hypothetical protein